jgi:hypothetical protein
MFGILDTSLLIFVVFFIRVLGGSGCEMVPFLLEGNGHPADGGCDVQVLDIVVFDKAADILILHITALDTQARKALENSFLNVIVREYFVAIGTLHRDKPIKKQTEIIIIEEQILHGQILKSLEHILCCL